MNNHNPHNPKGNQPEECVNQHKNKRTTSNRRESMTKIKKHLLERRGNLADPN
jgi:hypothetical protein